MYRLYHLHVSTTQMVPTRLWRAHRKDMDQRDTGRRAHLSRMGAWIQGLDDSQVGNQASKQ